MQQAVVIDKPPDELTPIVIAYQWAARITGLSISMVVPGLLGYLADSRLGTKVLFTLIGFAAGMAYAGWQLIRIAAQANPPRSGEQKTQDSRRKRD